MAGSGNRGGKVSVAAIVFSSHEREIYPNDSFAENCFQFEIQTDRNYHVDFEHTYLALKLKFVKDRGYETYNTKEKNEHDEEAKADEETEAAEEEEEAPVPLVTHVNNILLSIFPMLKCTSTISKFTSLMDCMRTNLTLITTSREPSLGTRGFCFARCTTTKNFVTKLCNCLSLILFSQGERKYLADLMASSCVVNWG